MTKDYVKEVDEEKKEIYYLIGNTSLDTLRSSPVLEKFKAKGINVLLLNDEVKSLKVARGFFGILLFQENTYYLF